MLDRSSSPLPADKSLSRAFKELLQTHSITDVWRLFNINAREYTFYSKRHNSYSRIDYLLMSNDLLENVLDSTIHSFLLSDHAPISVTFYPSSEKKSKHKQWSFNNSLLRDDAFVRLIKKYIKEFVEINMNPSTPISIVWEAFKATCRGWIISYASYKNKEKRRRKTELLSKLKDLESKHMRDPMNTSLKQELFLTRAEAQAMLQEDCFFIT